MDVLVCDPEGHARGGLSFALELLAQAADSAQFRIWRLQRIDSQSGFRLINPQQLLEATGPLERLLELLNPAVFVGVGWHTWSESAVRSARLKQIPVVFWSHGVGCWVLYRVRPLAGLVRWLLRAPGLAGVMQTLRWVDVLVVAYPGRPWWDTRSLDVPLARRMGSSLRTIANPIDTAFWTVDRNLISPERSQLLSMGRLEWQKGHMQVLEILARAQLANSRLLCLAPQWTSHAKQWNARATALGLERQAQLEIGLDAVARRTLLRQSLVYISWSETEYQSLAMLEAMACGCAVIARPRGWLCGRAVPGVLVTNSQHQASRWLARLMEQPDLARRIGDSGAHYVQAHHSSSLVQQQWAHLLTELLQR